MWGDKFYYHPFGKVILSFTVYSESHKSGLNTCIYLLYLKVAWINPNLYIYLMKITRKYKKFERLFILKT
jgi:hypothetical protein